MLCTEIAINPEDVMMKQKSEELRERFQNRRGGGRRF